MKKQLQKLKPGRHVILGIDCGTAITGWAFISTIIDENGRKSKAQLLDYGIIHTHKFTPEEQRLKDLGDSLGELIAEFKPQQIAVEDLFFFKNAKTVIKVSQARGVVIYKAMEQGVDFFSYTPLQVKLQITGNGRGEKTQVMFMVSKIFDINKRKIQDDAADAIAIAYTHFLSI